ncbi:hypothetical protein ACROYT_G043591 [Oculina patagonica]
MESGELGKKEAPDARAMTQAPQPMCGGREKRETRVNNVVVDLDSLDDILLPTPPPVEEEGIWKLERKFVKDKKTNTVTTYMVWVNVLEDQAVLPDVITDPAAREREQLREERIENPFEEEQHRIQKEKEMWNLKQEKRLCSALKRKRHDFSKAAKSMPNKTSGDCVSHWYQYKKDESHIKACNTCIKRRNDKRKRKRAKELQEDEETASPPKRSKMGRTIKVPRRFCKGPEGRQL